MAQPKYALSYGAPRSCRRPPAPGVLWASYSTYGYPRMTLIYPPLWRGRRIELKRVLRWARRLLAWFLNSFTSSERLPHGSSLRPPLPLSPLSPQAGYITVNYDYELWAELGRGGALGFLQDRLAHTFSRILSILSIIHGAKRKTLSTRLCVLSPRRRSDACRSRGEKGRRGRELRLHRTLFFLRCE